MRKYTTWVVNNRWVIIALTLIITVAMGAKGNTLKVIIDPDKMLPQDHPYIMTTNEVERIFGSRWVMEIGITPKTGDAFQPAVLEKVKKITDALQANPLTVKSTILSIAARRAKNIKGDADGMSVLPLMDKVPTTPEGLEALRKAVHSNPVFENGIISKDDRTLAIMSDFRLSQGFGGIVASINPIIDSVRDPSVEIHVSGLPGFLALLEKYSQRMAFLFPISLLLIGLIHFEAFRTKQAIFLPLVTAMVAVTWAKGIMGIFQVPMDIFNMTTPILILAIAAGHAVQILKRYYEEFNNFRAKGVEPKQANREAVIEAVTKVGPVMITACAIAALGFFSLVVFEISTVRTFGVFTALGVLSALILEMTFIPALRSVLPAPKAKEQAREKHEGGVWDRITGAMANWVTGPNRKGVFVAAAAIVLFGAIGSKLVIYSHSDKNFFFQSVPQVQDDTVLNERMGGTNTIYVYVHSKSPDAIKDPKVLQAMDETQRWLETQPYVGKTISIADFIKRMNKAMHGDDPAFDKIPTDQNLIAQYLLLYSSSGDPQDFDSYVDTGYKAANILVLMHTDNTDKVKVLLGHLQAFTATHFPNTVEISEGGAITSAAALADVIVHDKVLNILQIAAVIFLISALVFRSLWAGLMVLAPLVLTVLANFGVMGFTGITLNVMTAIMSPMAVGIGADYAIYLLFRLKEEIANGSPAEEAIRKTLSTAGKAILFVASAVAGGYGVLVFSFGFKVHLWMAIIIGIAMLVSSLATLSVVPALVLAFRPKFVFGEAAAPKTGVPPAAAAASILALTVGLSFMPGTARADAPLSAHDIMAKNLVSTRVFGFSYEGTMTLLSPDGQERVRKVAAKAKLQPNGVDTDRLVRFLDPPDVRGTATLLDEHAAGDDDIWIYLPALKKVRRLVSSNKKDSFLGTDFSYGDVIGFKVDEWDHKLVGEEKMDGQDCYVIESAPKNDDVKSVSGYSKRKSWIRKDGFVTVRAEYWDVGGQPLKWTRWSDYSLVDPAHGRWWFAKSEAMNVQTKHRTRFQFSAIKVESDLSDDLFSSRNLEKDF
jgi:hydrophobe/amphiphile efflux-3 (HAE3) family protein